MRSPISVELTFSTFLTDHQNLNHGVMMKQVHFDDRVHFDAGNVADKRERVHQAAALRVIEKIHFSNALHLF